MTLKPDDLDAVRKITEALQGFQAADQERILRWVREKAGLTAPLPAVKPPADPPAAGSHHHGAGGQGRDLRAFVAAKTPGSDVQFAATVAYYYRFEAPESERKAAVNAQDLLDACRKAGRARLQNPGLTLRNAHRSGLLDRADRGAFSINAVGENLVAMTLPSGASTVPAPKVKRRAKSPKAKKSPKRR